MHRLRCRRSDHRQGALPYDISPIFDDESSDEAVSLRSLDDVAALRDVAALSRPCERLVRGAYSVGGHARMMGEPDAFEELLDAVAAEANHGS